MIFVRAAKTRVPRDVDRDVDRSRLTDRAFLSLLSCFIDARFR
jgi:hypothetical protein